MKIYLITWGYYSSMDSTEIIQAIYSTHEKALSHIQNNEFHDFKELEQLKHRKTGKLLNTWTDEDYWVAISEGFIDSPNLYSSGEEK